jgi:putative oxidoreductase
MNMARLDWAPLPLRLVIGFGFAYHGAPKIFSGQEHQNFVGLLDSIGVPLSGLMSWLVGILEFFGGLALMVGVLVAPVALLLTVNMLVALFTVHISQGFNFLHITGMSEAGQLQFGMPGFEVNLLYIGGLIALALSGAGAASIERMRSGGGGSSGGALPGSPAP